LATPKTDIIQAVGRILRVKHERPLVIDIIDTHETFISQWQKRRKYYASNKYKILHTNSLLYEANVRADETTANRDIWKNLSDLSKGKGKGKCKEGDVYVSLETKMKGQCMIDLNAL